MTQWTRDEIEEQYRLFIAAGDAQDWDAWADLHSEDGVWIEHHLGTFNGREEIRACIKKAMAGAPAMEFPVEWHAIEGNRVVYYPWQVFPDPTGGDAVYRFGCVTILEYAGDGLWSYQEDVYNPVEAGEVVGRWVKAGGKMPGA
jgi:ketosteroid isomerase-like protein